MPSSPLKHFIGSVPGPLPKFDQYVINLMTSPYLIVFLMGEQVVAHKRCPTKKKLYSNYGLSVSEIKSFPVREEWRRER